MGTRSLEGCGGPCGYGGLPEALVGPDPAEAGRKEDALRACSTNIIYSPSML